MESSSGDRCDINVELHHSQHPFGGNHLVANWSGGGGGGSIESKNPSIKKRVYAVCMYACFVTQKRRCPLSSPPSLCSVNTPAPWNLVGRGRAASLRLNSACVQVVSSKFPQQSSLTERPHKQTVQTCQKFLIVICYVQGCVEQFWARSHTLCNTHTKCGSSHVTCMKTSLQQMITLLFLPLFFKHFEDVFVNKNKHKSHQDSQLGCSLAKDYFSFALPRH